MLDWKERKWFGVLPGDLVGGGHTSPGRGLGVMDPGDPQAAGKTRERRACHPSVP